MPDSRLNTVDIDRITVSDFHTYNHGQYQKPYRGAPQAPQRV